MSRAWTVALLVTALAACGSDRSSVAPTTTAVPASGITPQSTVTASNPPDTLAPSTAPPGAPSAQTVTYGELASLLPVLAPTTPEGTYVVELRERIIEVRATAGRICVVTTCQAPTGVIVHSDQSPPTPVYVVLTAADVLVELSSQGGGLTCFTERASTLGPLAVSWCEDRFPSLATFTAPNGSVYAVAVG